MSLYQLRKESGMKWHEVIARAQEYDPNFPTTAAGLACLERRGTENYHQLVALGHVYGKSFAEILLIASPPKESRTAEIISRNAKYALTTV